MTEMAEAVLKLYPDVKGYFGTNEHATNAVLDAVSASGREIAVLGIDAGKKQIDAVKKGTEIGTFVQNSYGMGYATVVAAMRADLELENDPLLIADISGLMGTALNYQNTLIIYTSKVLM